MQLSATVRDFHDNVIPNAVVTWASAPASIATVSSTGLVTGGSPGMAVVTASSGGAFAADTITVRRPVADWSSAVEWTTYQGNASHTGYNPVAMDTRVFQELWSRNVSSAALNPVTAGDGKVFVSTNAYFGVQQAKSLDARTGTELWSRDFGNIHSVHPPATPTAPSISRPAATGTRSSGRSTRRMARCDSRRAYLNQWSRYYAPVIVGTSVYVAGGYYGGMYAFSATEGVQRWFAQLNQYDQFTPAVKDGLVYAYTGNNKPKLTVADATTGAVAYEIADPGFVWDGWSMNSAPTLGGASNVLATNGGRLISVQSGGAQHWLRDSVQRPRAADRCQRRRVRRDQRAGRSPQRERRRAPLVVDAAGGAAGRTDDRHEEPSVREHRREHLCGGSRVARSGVDVSGRRAPDLERAGNPVHRPELGKLAAVSVR